MKYLSVSWHKQNQSISCLFRQNEAEIFFTFIFWKKKYISKKSRNICLSLSWHKHNQSISCLLRKSKCFFYFYLLFLKKIKKYLSVSVGSSTISPFLVFSARDRPKWGRWYIFIKVLRDFLDNIFHYDDYCMMMITINRHDVDDDNRT